MVTHKRPGFDRDDGSCLACDGHAVQRTGQHGPFVGCSAFPACRNTEPIRRRTMGSLLISGDDIDLAYADAFYDGDGKW